MANYKIAKIASKLVNLLTLESLITQRLINNALRTPIPTIITTVHPQTHSQYQEQINQLSANPNIRVVPYYYPLIYAHHASALHFQTSDNPNRVSLLIGNNNSQMITKLDSKRTVTLEEVCRAFPEKVPLSMRDKNSTAARERLEERVGMKMSREKVIHFENILVISPEIGMWDQAFQVILDCQPSPIIFPYLKPKIQQNQLYRLGLIDFLSGLRKIHQTVSTAVKTHPPLNIVHFDQKKQLNWLISEVAGSAQQMVIDENFFTEPPKLKECGGAVKIIRQLKEAL